MIESQAFFSKMVDELVEFSEFDPELSDGIKWLDDQAQKKGITFYDMVFEVLYKHDVNSKANYLNENNIATIIQESGFRLWGNRTLSADPKWAFLQARRTADMINDSLLKAHLWAVDRNITKTYIEDVLEGVNNYLRYLR